MVENELLKQARALYKDRLRIALSALIIVAFLTFSYFFTSGYFPSAPPEGIHSGWTQGLAVVTSLNSIGFILSIAAMVAIYQFWSWAFLPGPALTYTFAILRGILGEQTRIKHSIGKRFKITLENGLQFEVSCKIKDRPSGEWFLYRLSSSEFKNEHLKEIALRHGFGVRHSRMVASVSSDELHLRTFLLTRAMRIASSL